jgi:hypothetical protein
MDSHLSVFERNKHNIKCLTTITQHNQHHSDLPHEHLLQHKTSITQFSSMTSRHRLPIRITRFRNPQTPQINTLPPSVVKLQNGNYVTTNDVTESFHISNPPIPPATGCLTSLFVLKLTQQACKLHLSKNIHALIRSFR